MQGRWIPSVVVHYDITGGGRGEKAIHVFICHRSLIDQTDNCPPPAPSRVPALLAALDTDYFIFRSKGEGGGRKKEIRRMEGEKRKEKKRRKEGGGGARASEAKVPTT